MKDISVKSFVCSSVNIGLGIVQRYYLFCSPNLLKHEKRCYPHVSSFLHAVFHSVSAALNLMLLRNVKLQRTSDQLEN